MQLLASCDEEYVPGLQGVGDDDPGRQKLPAGQKTGTADFGGQYLPATHNDGFSAPGGQKFPSVQGIQARLLEFG